MPAERFFFMHMQKTAGTALWRRLGSQFAPGELYPGPRDGSPPTTTVSVPHLLAVWQQRSPEIRVVTGHFPLCVAGLLGGGFTTFTVLRDPVERTLSFLRHHREVTPDDAHRSLEEIYDDPVRRELVCNHMVKMLSLDIHEMTDGALTPVAFTDARVRAAQRRLEELDVVGFQDDFEAFCTELSRRYGWDLGPPVFMNRTAPAPTPASLRRRIEADNQADIELFAHARSLLGPGPPS